MTQQDYTLEDFGPSFERIRRKSPRTNKTSSAKKLADKRRTQELRKLKNKKYLAE